MSFVNNKTKNKIKKLAFGELFHRVKSVCYFDCCYCFDCYCYSGCYSGCCSDCSGSDYCSADFCCCSDYVTPVSKNCLLIRSIRGDYNSFIDSR